jgi:threonine dehydratase
MAWDPAQYLKFAGPRLRPAIDLLGHIEAEAPRLVYDLGCGAGNVTRFIGERWPEARVVGVEPAGAPKLTSAFAAGEPVELLRTASLADGLLAVRIGTVPFEHHRAFVEQVVTLDDAPLRRAMRFLLDRCKLVAEPSGAITVAALLEGAVAVRGPTVLVLSGGNVEWGDLARLLG